MRRSILRSAPLALLVLAASASFCGAGDLSVSFLFNLANFSGPVPFGDVRLFADATHDEVYVADGDAVRVFNESGMETYSFGADPELGVVYDLALDEDGDILLLSYDHRGAALDRPLWFITRCDYRGEPQERITLTNLPAQYSAFGPNVLLYRNGRMILANKGQMLVVVTDRSGVFEKAYDLAAMIGVEDEDRPDAEISGLSLDAEGRLLFTAPALFRAFVVDPDGTVRSFGKPGSAPGSFGIAADIVGDRQGRYFVADRLRSVVMVFDKNLKFVEEFGRYGDNPENLVRPTRLVLGQGKLYVTQMRNRGVSVFSVTPS